MSANGSRQIFLGMDERWVSVSGARLRYQVGGSGPPLVLVHGIAASSFSFRFNCAALMSEFQVFVPELLSMEYPDRTPCLDCSLRAIAMRLADFLGEVGVGRASILGSSYGGAVAMQLAALAPQRLDSLLLVSPANPFAQRYRRVVSFYLSAIGGVFIRLVPYMPGRVWDYGIGRMYADPASMVAGTGIGYALPLRRRTAIAQILSYLKTFSNDVGGLRPLLPAIAKIPTLLIWGNRDPVVELESGYQLQKALGAEMMVVTDVGHLPYEEAPAEFNRLVSEWLKTQSTVRPAENATDRLIERPAT